MVESNEAKMLMPTAQAGNARPPRKKSSVDFWRRAMARPIPIIAAR